MEARVVESDVDVVEAMLSRANAHDVDGFFALCAGDVYFENSGWAGGHDVEGLRAFLLDTWEGFPDLRYQPTGRVVGGDTTVLECTATGTNTGPIRGRPPTNRPAEWHLVFIVQVAGGWVRSWKTYFDRVALWQQLGWI